MHITVILGVLQSPANYVIAEWGWCMQHPQFTDESCGGLFTG
ncbi:hypothetical protein Z947_1430 [Sulfitobacter geojensis]|nr:hypothetical protein Z947_1430 [Sulfitobacter geojensis]